MVESCKLSYIFLFIITSGLLDLSDKTMKNKFYGKFRDSKVRYENNSVAIFLCTFAF